MAILASALIDEAARLLFDTNNVKWSRRDLLGYLSDGQRLVCILQPNSSNTISAIKLVAGARQSLPANAWVLLEVIRNMGTTGTAPGRSIRLVPRSLLDTFNPNWTAEAGKSEVQNYTYDEQDIHNFFVYPPSNGTNYVEVNFSEIPAPLTSESASLGLPDVYYAALLDYVLYRACSKAVQYAPGMDVAMQHLTAFNNWLGAKVTAEQANNPNTMLKRGAQAGAA